MYSESIQKLIEAFSKLPSVGPRTAARFAFYIIKAPREEVKGLMEAIAEARKSTKLCSLCFNPFENPSDNTLCDICSDPRRTKNILCIVEKESDLMAINQAKTYKGIFFVLGGTLSPMRKENIRKIRVKELIERVKDPERYGAKKFDEIIIATNFTSEGEATALYLERILKEVGVKVTRLARGLPKGGELEYIDEETISSALEGRK